MSTATRNPATTQASTVMKITKETRVGVLYGGLSSEREVSLRSGNNCFKALERLGFKNAQLVDVDTNISSVLQNNKIEVAFLALHGKYGEDGAIQGLLELLRIPYSGSGVLASALGMNKPLTKQVLKSANLPYPPTYIVREEDMRDYQALESKLFGVPAMVKPLAEGSSVGVHKITDAAMLKPAIEETIAKYTAAIVEKYIHGPEITVGVLDEADPQTNARKVYALPILELRPKSKAGFYDYEAKYTKGMTEFVLPAELSEATTKLAQQLAVETFKALNCSGYARVDMMVDKAEGKPYVLEVNTLPGMTDTSDLPAMAEVAGISYDSLVEKILLSAGLDK